MVTHDIANLSLDFIAARLAEPADLSLTLSEGGVLSLGPAVTPEEFADALRLQRALDRSMRAVSAGSLIDGRDVATINSYAADELPSLVLQGDGRAARVAIDPVRAGLAAIARDAIETIARAGRELRVCAAPGCNCIFLDRSRGKRRRWCSMQTCGNRAKVAAFRMRPH